MKGTARKVVTLIEPSLKDSELRYRRLFEAAQDGILILDAETGMITDVNPFLIKMLGYSREEFVEKKLWEVGAFKDIEASKLSRPCRRMNIFATKTCRSERRTAGWLVWNSSVMSIWWAAKKLSSATS